MKILFSLIIFISIFGLMIPSYSYFEGSPYQIQEDFGNSSSWQSDYCKEELTPLFKSSTRKIVCVKPETVKILQERDWGVQRDIVFLMDKEEYEIGEEITITMKNIGTEIYYTNGRPLSLIIIEEDGKRIWSSSPGGVMTAESQFHPGQEVTHTFVPNESTSQIIPGIYKVISGDYGLNNDGENKLYTFEKPFKIVEPTEKTM